MTIQQKLPSSDIMNDYGLSSPRALQLLTRKRYSVRLHQTATRQTL